MCDIFYHITDGGTVINENGIQESFDERVFNILVYGSPLSGVQVPASPFFKCRNLIANLRCIYILGSDCRSDFEYNILESIGDCIDLSNKDEVVLINGVWDFESPDIHLLIKNLYKILLKEISKGVVVGCSFSDEDFSKVGKYLNSDLEGFDYAYMIGDYNTVVFYTK